MVEKAGVNGLLDVARQTFKEANADAYQLVTDLGRGSPISNSIDGSNGARNSRAGP